MVAWYGDATWDIHICKESSIPRPSPTMRKSAKPKDERVKREGLRAEEPLCGKPRMDNRAKKRGKRNGQG